MALVEAISNGGSGLTATRSNAFRSGYFARDRVLVRLGATTVPGVIKSSLSITERIGGEPSTADLAIKGGRGVVPTRGQEVVIGHGTFANRIFAGRVIRAQRTVARHVEPKPTYALECTDYTRDLGTVVPATGFVARSVSAASVIGGLLAVGTPSPAVLGVSPTYVAPTLPVVSEFISGPDESLVDAFDRLADIVDAAWYLDARKAIHFFQGGDDPQPRPTINTLTPTSTRIWDLAYTTDLANVITRVVGLGGTIRTSMDIYSDETQIPVTGAEPVADSVITGDEGDSYRASITHHVTVAGIPRSFAQINDASELLYKEAIWQASPFSLTPDGYWIGGFVATWPPIGGMDYMRGRRWWSEGAWSWRVASFVTVSTSANTIYRHFAVPKEGPGAPPPTALGVIEDGRRLTAPAYFEMRCSPSSITPRYVIPQGSEIRAYYTAANTPAINAVSSLTGSATLGVITGVVDDRTLPPMTLVPRCDTALERGQPSRWQTLTFATRDTRIGVGQVLHVSLPNPGEPSGPTIAGTFTVQDITIDGFDRATDALGPTRTVTASGATRKTLWSRLR